MYLILTITPTGNTIPGAPVSKTFDSAGGLIGRDAQCEWVFPDASLHVSNCHAHITFREGCYYISDYKSSNGTFIVETGTRLEPGQPHLIVDGMVIALAQSHITARLSVDRLPVPASVGAGPALHYGTDQPYLAGTLNTKPWPFSESPAPAVSAQPHDHAPTHTQHMVMPNLVPETVEAPAPDKTAAAPQSPEFWQRLGDSLGLDLEQLDQSAREALAINAAQLLKACVAGLHQSLYTRDQLKAELRVSPGPRNSHWQQTSQSQPVLHGLLSEAASELHRAEQAITQGFDALQAHQLAMLAGCRAALRGTLQQFAPEQLVLRFEQNGQPSRWSASRWRTYCRHHQAVSQDPDWQARLLGRDFAQAYEEHERLIGALHRAY